MLRTPPDHEAGYNNILSYCYITLHLSSGRSRHLQATSVKVTEAHLDSGLLRIDIEQPVLEPAVRHVEIKSGAHDESASLGIEAGGSAASREGKTP